MPDTIQIIEAPTRSPFLTTDALAERWGIDRKTVLNAIQSGDVPCTKVGRRWLIPLAWINTQENAGLPASRT